jgi:hypothetical protein
VGVRPGSARPSVRRRSSRWCLRRRTSVTCKASSTSLSRAVSATRSSRGSAAERTCLFRPTSFAPRSAATKSSKWRSISGLPPTPRSGCCRSIFRASSTRQVQAARCHRPDSASNGLLRSRISAGLRGSSRPGCRAARCRLRDSQAYPGLGGRNCRQQVAVGGVRPAPHFFIFAISLMIACEGRPRGPRHSRRWTRRRRLQGRDGSTARVARRTVPSHNVPVLDDAPSLTGHHGRRPVAPLHETETEWSP